MIVVKKVKVRFEKYKCETSAAYLLKYKGLDLWFPKRFTWNVLVAGNDKHAWATIPVWLIELKTGIDVNKLVGEIGISGIKEKHNIYIEEYTEEHIPKRIDPVENNTIKKLKR